MRSMTESLSRLPNKFVVWEDYLDGCFQGDSGKLQVSEVEFSDLFGDGENFLYLLFLQFFRIWRLKARGYARHVFILSARQGVETETMFYR